MIVHSFLKKKNAEHITAISDTNQTIADPTLNRYGTNIKLADKPIKAPIIELIKTALSLPIGIRDWVIIICSNPIIKTNGAIILSGKTAPSYPGPAIILIISGAKISISITHGIEKANSIEIDFFISLSYSAYFCSDKIDAIRGINTPVTAVNAINIIV